MSVLIHDHSNIHQGGKLHSATADASVGPDTSSGGSGSGITLPVAGGDVSLADTGNYFTTDNAEAALQQLGAGLYWFNVKAYGALADGTTDDTVAIQAAITACVAAGGGTVFFPNGVYQISGALQNTGTHNAQLIIPTVATTNASGPVAIRFLGMGPNVTESDLGGNPLDSANPIANGAILRSDWNGAISGNPAIISAGAYASPSTSWVMLTFQDISIQAPGDPKLSAIEARASFGLRLNQVMIGTSVNANARIMPTHSNAVAIGMPPDSQQPDNMIGVKVENFYVGMRASEQACGSDLSFGFCTQAVQFVGNVGAPLYTQHANQFGKILAHHCKYGLVFTGDLRWVNIGLFDVEHDLGIWATTYDIDDASNYARGFISHHSLLYGTGIDAILVNGGTGLSLYGAHSKLWKLNNVVEIPTGTDPSTNAATGGRLYAASATGHPTWRDSAGTVTDLLTGTGPAFATPAIVHGTAAAAGAAATVIRSDSTIVTFDTTVPATQAFGDAAATGSAAIAARRDHVHGMPAAPATSAGSDHEHVDNIVFSGDGATTVWELPAAPVSDTGISVYVTGSRSIAWVLSGTLLTTLTFDSAPASAANNIVIDIEAAVA